MNHGTWRPDRKERSGPEVGGRLKRETHQKHETREVGDRSEAAAKNAENVKGAIGSPGRHTVTTIANIDDY